MKMRPIQQDEEDDEDLETVPVNIVNVEPVGIEEALREAEERQRIGDNNLTETHHSNNTASTSFALHHEEFPAFPEMQHAAEPVSPDTRNLMLLVPDYTRDEIIMLGELVGEDNIINAFKCREMILNEEDHISHLVVTHTELILVRCLGGGAELIWRRPLHILFKITTNRPNTDVITLLFRQMDVDGHSIIDRERFVFPVLNQEEFSTCLQNQCMLVKEELEFVLGNRAY